MHYTIGGNAHYVYADARSTGTNFYYDTGPNMIDSTQGTLFPGVDGVVQIQIPAAQGAVGRATLQGPWAESDEDQQVNGGGIVFVGTTPQADRAPNGGTGKDYTIGAPCPIKATISVLTHQVSERAVSKAGAVTIALRASASVTSVTLKLTHGHKTVASGRLHRLSGRGTVRLPIKGKLALGGYSVFTAAKDSATGVKVRGSGHLTVTR
jgi:hypothetical protein